MTYPWEWLGELSVIPAFACFLAGVLAGMLLTLAVIAFAACLPPASGPGRNTHKPKTGKERSNERTR